MLSSCVADRLAFWKDDSLHKQYGVLGLDDNPDTKDYVQGIIDNRMATFKVEDDAQKDQALRHYQEVVRQDLMKAMRAKGYYNATISYTEGTDDDVQGTYNIQSGEQAIIENITISPKQYAGQLKTIEVMEGQPLFAQNVLDAQKTIRQNLQKESCAFDLHVSHRAYLNRETHKADIQFTVKQGEHATYGDITFEGQNNIRTSHLEKYLTIKRGECFRHDKIVATRDKLLATGLFSKVEISLPENGNEGGAIPVKFIVKERAHRTVKAGLSYYTDEGVGATAGWEHRNFLGAGEKLNVDLTLSALEQSLNAKLNKPFFMRKDQSLTFNAGLSRKTTDAFDELGMKAGIGLSRQLNKRMKVNIGSDINITQIKEDNEETRTFGLFSPNTSFNYDSRDDKLDPRKGWLLYGEAEGFIDTFGEASPFIKTEFGARHYIQAHKRLIWANRVKLGTIAGTETDDLPATERFFAGGGGSVRGFGFQEVGPKESDGDPAGGRSLFEAGTELRLKFTDTLGMVAFVDAGHVGDKVVPTFEDLSVGAGVGARYYTDFGPLRFDIATPVSGKDSDDATLQVYISIGQAF